MYTGYILKILRTINVLISILPRLIDYYEAANKKKNINTDGTNKYFELS